MKKNEQKQQAALMLTCCFFYRMIPRISATTFRGHPSAHAPQDRQRLSSIQAHPSCICIAPLGQSFTHRPQAIQLTSQGFLAAAPLSWPEQRTMNISPALCIRMFRLGRTLFQVILLCQRISHRHDHAALDLSLNG